MYLEPCQTSEMDLFVKIVKIFQPLITFYKKLSSRKKAVYKVFYKKQSPGGVL